MVSTILFHCLVSFVGVCYGCTGLQGACKSDALVDGVTICKPRIKLESGKSICPKGFKDCFDKAPTALSYPKHKVKFLVGTPAPKFLPTSQGGKVALFLLTPKQRR